METMLGHRATADLALLQLAMPAKGRVPAALAAPGSQRLREPPEPQSSAVALAQPG